MRIVEEFCRIYNCTIGIVRDDAQAWGNIFDNGTGLGVIGNVFEDKADFAMSGIGHWHSSFKHLDFSTYLLKSSITCITPAAKLKSKWELPLLPFTWMMWLAIFASVIVSCLALVVIQGCSSDRIVLSTYSIIVAQPVTERDKSWRRRSITIWIILSSFLLNNAYSSGLSATFTVLKYDKSVDTVQDLIDRKMLWAALHEAWIYQLLPSKEPKIKQIVKQFRALNIEEMKKRTFDKNMAFGVVKLAAGYISIGDFLTEEVASEYELMEESLYFDFSVIMGRKGSPYINKLNKLILRLHESGLLLAWETQIALKHLNYKVQQAIRFSRLKNKQRFGPLSWSHVLGIFIIYFSGVTLSILVFIRELSKQKN